MPGLSAPGGHQMTDVVKAPVRRRAGFSPSPMSALRWLTAATFVLVLQPWSFRFDPTWLYAAYAVPMLAAVIRLAARGARDGDALRRVMDGLVCALAAGLAYWMLFASGPFEVRGSNGLISFCLVASAARSVRDDREPDVRQASALADVAVYVLTALALTIWYFGRGWSDPKPTATMLVTMLVVMFVARYVVMSVHYARLVNRASRQAAQEAGLSQLARLVADLTDDFDDAAMFRTALGAACETAVAALGQRAAALRDGSSSTLLACSGCRETAAGDLEPDPSLALVAVVPVDARFALSLEIYGQAGQTLGVADTAFARSVADLVATMLRNREVLEARRSAELALGDAMAQLRETLDSYDLALRAGEMGVWRHDVTTAATARSPHAAVLLGIEDDPSGSLWEVIHPEDRYLIADARQALAGGEELRHLEYRVLLPDGAVRWLSDDARREVGPDGELIAYYGVMRDITAAKLSEEALREQDERLAQMQRMESIGQLAGGVAHDFNNMLAVMLGNLESLEDRTESAEPELVQLRQALMQGKGLVEQLLTFSRRRPAATATAVVGDTVEQLEPLLTRMAGSHVALRTEIGDGRASVALDPVQFQQILFNLVGNARDAMPDGGELVVSTQRVGDTVRLLVRDTGAGMEPGIVAHALEPFFSTKPPGKGTGLGLPVVYGLATQCGGSVRIDSAVGKGTTVVVELPRVEAMVEAAAPQELPAPAAPAANARVLLVEDQLEIRALLEKALTRAGYAVCTAVDGQTALELAQGSADQFDIIVTDVIMPRMTGPQFVKRLTGDEAATAVVYMSGYAAPESLPDSGPGIAFVQKPFTFADLRRAMQQALAGKGDAERA